MNGRQAKAQRRQTQRHQSHEEQRLTELVMQAHDRLHKDDPDACHEILHVALGTGYLDIDPLAHRSGFDAGFRALCTQHGVRAAFVMIDRTDETGQARLIGGGDAQLDALLAKALRS